MRNLLTIFAIFFEVTVNAQAKHNYLSGRCKLAGQLRAESGYCPGCAEDDRKNNEAKKIEDKRIQAIAVQKAEAQRQKAIEENKRQNEKIAAEIKKQKENELHFGRIESKNSSQTEVKKEKITTDKRFQLKDNKRDNKWGFDDANDEPLLYSEDYEYTKTKDGTDGLRYPVGYGVVYYKNKNADIVDYKGNRILKDDTINQILYVWDKWFLALSGYEELRMYSRDRQFKYGYFVNIETGEKVSIPFSGIIVATDKGSAAYLDSGFAGLITNIRPLEEYTGNRGDKMRLLLSDFIGIDIKDWKALVKFRMNDNSGYGAYYYIDKNKKLIKVNSSISFYNLKRQYQDKYGYLEW